MSCSLEQVVRCLLLVLQWQWTGIPKQKAQACLCAHLSVQVVTVRFAFVICLILFDFCVGAAASVARLRAPPAVLDLGGGLVFVFFVEGEGGFFLGNFFFAGGRETLPLGENSEDPSNMQERKGFGFPWVQHFG